MKVFFQLATPIHFTDILEMMGDFYAIDNYLFDYELSAQNLLEFTSNEHLGKIWVILYSEEIIGYLILTFGYSFEYGGRDAFIDELYLKKPFRGRRIGDQCMLFLENEAPRMNIKAIHLEVEPHNVRGNKLYKRHGYTGNDRKLLTRVFE